MNTRRAACQKETTFQSPTHALGKPQPWHGRQAGGQLRDWGVEGRLSGARLPPALLTRGENDEVAAASSQRLAAALPGAQLAEFAGAGSYHHIDAWEPFLERVDGFLSAHDGVAA